MQQLFLSGGGSGKQTIHIDRAFIAQLPKKHRVLYIPIAMRHGPFTFSSCWDWFRGDYSKVGLKSFDMWTDVSFRTFDELSRYDAIYIGGGNTFELLHELRSTKFDRLLFRFLSTGKPIFGGSAGAIIWGSHINTAVVGDSSDVNKIGLKNCKGFNKIRNYTIHCHYTPKDDGELFDLSRKLKTKIIALSKDVGLSVTDTGVQVVGRKSAYVFTAKSKVAYRPGSII